MPRTIPRSSQEDLDSFCKKIAEHCGADVVVAVCKPPSYISCFFQRYTSDIILLHRKDNRGDTSLEDSFSFHNTSYDDGTPLDITGNPLEHPFNDVSILNDTSIYMNDVKVTVMPPGLDMIKSGTALNLYNMLMPDNSLPIWAVCDGSQSKDGGIVRLMCSTKSDDAITDGWAIDTGSRETEPDPNTFVSKHEKRCKYKSPNNPVLCSRRKISINAQDVSSSLTFIWTQPAFHPPITSKSLRISMTTECTTGSSEGPLKFIWEQLLLLNTFLKSYVNDGASSIEKLPTSEYVSSLLTTNETAASRRLLDILQEPIRQAKTSSETKTSSKTNFLIDFVSEVSSPSYCDLDVLGKLWYLFLACSPLDLKVCMETLQEEIRNKQLGTHMYQIISVTSLSQVTELVSPLKHLIEFGVLKLQKEMILILSKHQFDFNMSTLPKFSGLRMPAWRKRVDTSLQWLAQSFCLLELVCHTQEGLNVQNEDLPFLARDCLDKLSCSGDTVKDIDWFIDHPIQQITINLLPQHVEKIIEGLPNEWLMELTSSKDRNPIVETRFFNGTVRPFVLPDQIQCASATLGSVSMNNTTLNLAGAEDAILWSAELHMRHHKIGKVVPQKM